MAAPSTLARLHRQILACTRCVEAGYLPQAAPVLSGHADNRIMLIGQAPGAVEAVRRLPFQGRSRNVLIGWLLRAGFSSEEQARRQIYMTSITKCFPGKGTEGGDRRPSRAEVDLCSSHLRPAARADQAGVAHPGRRAGARTFPSRPRSRHAGRPAVRCLRSGSLRESRRASAAGPAAPSVGRESMAQRGRKPRASGPRAPAAPPDCADFA